MIAFAHIAGVPVEETIPMLAGPGGMLLLARAWLRMHLRRLGAEDGDGGSRRRPAGDQCGGGVVAVSDARSSSAPVERSRAT